ncbi:hypothetical protein KFZ58_03560 [Virgibacillus sp. NKC19-16]|uniref:DUF6612 family protein n=1 Tax=Virgibacillus salidurans TaxID=2831673 RepID=UPI001F3629D2|nr:DUF6612 family protein [Virgibacillus sp. NKC19-16]UJL47033.1 hypothetical protein KFZ58_03560 [Virgibacillus sp. NKC19-16]
MKKWMLVVFAGVMAFVLAACNDTAEPTADTIEEEESELTAQEVYSEALEASEEMESAEVSMNMQQQIASEAESTSIDTESSFDMQMTMDPLAIYQEGTTKMMMDGEEGMPEMGMEMYMVDDGMYMYSDQIGNWMKVDNAAMDAVNAMDGQQQDPSEQLKMLQEYTDDLSFEQSDDEFILTLNADGEKFNELIQEVMEESLTPEMTQAMGEEGQNALENMTINSMDYEMFIDKESFDMNAFNMNMDMTMEAEGDAINLVQNLESSYSNINNVDPIEVPEEIENNAIEQQ